MNITEDMRETLFGRPQKVFATICPNRTTKPVVSLHSTVGQAKNAVVAQTKGGYDRDKGGHQLREAEIYHLVEGIWVLLYRVEDGTYPNDLPWK